MKRLLLFVAALFVGSATFLAQGQAPPKAPAKGITQDLEHPILPIGAPAPDFSLPGIDGKTHTLKEFAGAKILAVAFECNHCPTSQLYEGRLEKLYDDFKAKGLQMVVINPNNPKSVRYDELGYTDMTDSLAEMKVRAQFRHFKWPYLYDGETQAVATKFGVVATPHIFLFDQQRKLVYQGRIDDSQREDMVKSQDARNALEAMVAGKPVPVAETKAFGCTTKWLSKAGDVEQERTKIEATPVTLTAATADDVKKLRANGTDKPLLMYVWPTNCTTCAAAMPDLMATYWMYHKERGFNLVTIAQGSEKDHDAALATLKKQYLAGPNSLYTGDHASLQTALGVTFKEGTPLTLVIGQDGTILYQKEGKPDIIQARRTILVHFPDTRGYIGQQAYWTAAVGATK